MRAFECAECGQQIFYRNDTCLKCRSGLAFRPSTRELEVLDPSPEMSEQGGRTRAATSGGGDDLRNPSQTRCSQFELIGCNWLVEDGDHGHCRSCRTTRTTPPQGDDDFLAAWRETEAAKRRVLFQMLELGLPLDVAEYDLVSSRVDDTVMIGHADGLVTIDVAETDDARRQRMRDRLDEPYRTVLGHIRHELGHALFPLLVTDPPDAALSDAVRATFGDWNDDYQDALDRHYEHGAPADWQEAHVSAYATMHPAEDWAESFAHVLHMTDVSQTAAAFGITVEQRGQVWESARTAAGLDAVGSEHTTDGDFRTLVAGWLPLTYALNAVTRSMGEHDLYPFVLSRTVVDKLALVHRCIEEHRTRGV